jgi:ribosomal protein S18 acetylase RimI-like enzyme
MIFIEEMSEDDFDNYLDLAIPNYAEEKVKAKNWHEEVAYEKSKKAFEDMLPEKTGTKNNYLFNIISESKKIGYLWILIIESPLEKEAYIADIIIFEEFRGKGLGTEVMKKVEEKAKQLRVNKISLHVFGHNSRAINLYKKMDFNITNLYMSKDL